MHKLRMSNFRSVTLSCVSLVLAVSALAGCDAEIDETDELANVEGELDPFGEEEMFRCALNGYAHAVEEMELQGSPFFPYPQGWFGSMSSTAPTNGYVSPSCGDYFVVHATDVDDPVIDFQYLWAEPFWADGIPSQSRCIWSVRHYDIAVKRGATWYQRTASFDVGNWNGSSCVIGGPILISDPYDDIEVVQVAVRGKYMDENGEHYARVGVRVKSSNCDFGWPC